MKKLIFSFIAVATAILVSCNEEFEEVTTIDIPNYRDGFPGKKDRITIPAISSVDKLRGCINIYPEYYDCFGKFTGSPLDRHEFQWLELQLISR